MHPSIGVYKLSYIYISFPLFLDVFKNYLPRKEQKGQGFITVFMSKVSTTENV